jgi:hypothetical protein
MKHIILTFLFTISAAFLFAQQSGADQQSIYPERVSKAKYFDKSNALRDVTPIVPGVRKRSWKNDKVTNPSIETPPNENVQSENEFLVDPAVQKEVYSNEVYWPIRNVMGLGNVNGVFPPDTEGDVGLNHYFLMINSSFAIYDKAGSQLYGPADNSTLWDGFEGPWSNTNDGDPIVLYDAEADRWFASQFALPNYPSGPFYQLIAISETGDPLGAWYRYAFTFSKMNDYPKFGIWHNGYLGTYNFFNANGGGYAGAGTVVLERDAMLIGDENARMIQFSISSGRYGILPADFDGTPPPVSEPAWFAHINRTGTKTLEIWKAIINWDNPSLSTYTLANNLTVQTFNANVNAIPQPNTTQTLDAIGGQLMYRLQYRNFGSYSTLVATQTVTANAKASIRWYELRKTVNDWSVYQQSTFAPDTDHRWMGSIAMNANGNIAIGYGVSSSTTYPSIRYVGRTANAPLNTLNIPESVIVNGASSQTDVERWGDYSSMSIDPSDDSTFWYAHMYRLSSNWRTQFASFNFAPGLPPQVDAGEDKYLCIDGTTVTTSATAIGAETVLWTTAGDGMLLYTNRLQTLYAPGGNDRTIGSVVLTCQVTGWNGDVVSDQLTVFINDYPQADAGNDTLICFNETLQMQGAAEFAESVLWQTAGDGNFDNANNLNAIYTPGNQDISNGSVAITLTANATETCTGQDIDNMMLTIDVCNALDENVTASKVVQVSPNPNDGKFSLIIGNKQKERVSWEINSVNGETIQKHEYRLNSNSINESMDLTIFPAGTYVIIVSVGSKTYSEKIVINK